MNLENVEVNAFNNAVNNVETVPQGSFKLSPNCHFYM